MGTAVWLYLYILDRTNWEEGVLFEYRDQDVADMLEIPKRTIRSWRQKLETYGYIACSQSLHSLKVFVHKWSDPREKWEINGSDKPDKFPPPLLPEEEPPTSPTKFSRLSLFFTQLTSIPELTGGAEKWNKAIQSWIDAGIEEADLIAAHKILRQKKFTILGPWSLTNTAIGEMSKRKTGQVSSTNPEVMSALYGDK